MNKKQFDFLEVEIYLYSTCNYNCSYCGGRGKDNEFGKAATKNGMGKIIEFCSNIEEGHIGFIGGEPTLHPHYVEFVSILTKRLGHFFHVTTNNSIKEEKLDKFINSVPPEKVDYIHCSLQEADEPQKRLNVFLDKVKKYKKNDFDVFVSYVAHPERLVNIKKYYNLFMGEGIPFVIKPFIGSYDNKSYPRDYSEEEKEILDEYMISTSHRVLLEIGDRRPKGKLCNAGHKRVRIMGSSGDLEQCQFLQHKLGNIYKEEWNLSDEPNVCPAWKCHCWTEPHLELQELYYKDLKNILNGKEHYDKEMYREYKNKALNTTFSEGKYKKHWEEKEKELLWQAFYNAQEKNIGIYGTGEHTTNMLKAYKKYKGNFNFDLFFFDSHRKKWGKEYYNQKIRSYEEIKDLDLDRIIISSFEFQEEIYENLKKFKKDDMKIIKLYDEESVAVF